MHQPNDLHRLVNALSIYEKNDLLQRGISLFISSKHAKVLIQNTSISINEMAGILGMSEKRYEEESQKVFYLLSRFLNLNNNSHFSNVELELAEAALLIELLKEKGEFTEASKKIKKALEVAKQYHLLSRQITFLHQQLHIEPYLNSLSDEQQVLLLKQIDEISKQQAEEEQLFKIYYQLLNERYKIAYRTSHQEQLEVFKLQELLQQYHAFIIKSHVSLIYYYKSLLLVDFMLGSTGNISSLNKNLLECWQQCPQLIQLHPELFIRSASLQSYTHFLAKNVESAEQYNSYYRSLSKNNLPSSFYQNWLAIIDYQTTLKILHKSYQYEVLATFFSANWPTVYPLLTVLRDAERIDILLASCITFFVLEKWNQAEDLLLEAKELNLKIKRLDSLYFTFVFHSLILFEKKEWNRLDSLIHAGYHYLYSHQKLRPFEKDMLLFIKKLPASRSKGMAREQISAFLNKLDSYKENNVQKLHFVTFDFYSWFESKVAGVSYKSHMKSKSVVSNNKLSV